MPRRILALIPVALLLSISGCDRSDLLNPNEPPTATLNLPADAYTGDEVALDGSPSTDPDGDRLSYEWILTSTPVASEAEIANADRARASFVPDSAGEYVVRLTVSDGNASASGEATMNVVLDTRLTGFITNDTTLGELRRPYELSGTLFLQAAVTIEPGVIVRAAEGALIAVTPSGSLSARGTESDSIRFVGEQATPGFWGGIVVGSDRLANALAFVDVAHAGADGGANVTVGDDDRLELSDSRLHHSAGHGLIAESGAALPEFARNEFHDNGAAPLLVPVSLMGALDAASRYAGGNAPDRIEVDGGFTAADATWPKTDAAYRILRAAFVDRAVTVAAGARIEFAEGTRLIVSEGSLTAVGTGSDSIRIAGAEAEAGFWDGIEIRSDRLGNRFEYVEIADAGADGLSNVFVTSSGSLRLANSTLRNSATHGLVVRNDAGLAEFGANAFLANAAAGLEVPLALMAALDSASVYAGGNGHDRIDVTGGFTAGDGTWPRTDAPFLIAGDGFVADSMTVQSGARVHFAEGTRLIVSAGSLTAIGTESDSIHFRGATETAGFWDGIEFRTSSLANELGFVRIGYGGASGLSNVYLKDNTRLSLTNSHIHDSANWGVFVETDATLVSDGSNAFADNASGDVGTQ